MILELDGTLQFRKNRCRRKHLLFRRDGKGAYNLKEFWQDLRVDRDDAVNTSPSAPRKKILRGSSGRRQIKIPVGILELPAVPQVCERKRRRHALAQTPLRGIRSLIGDLRFHELARLKINKRIASPKTSGCPKLCIVLEKNEIPLLAARGKDLAQKSDDPLNRPYLCKGGIHPFARSFKVVPA